jgi:hypothetical protein
MGNAERIQERFWAKVAVGQPEDCWPWQGYCTGKGYGRFGLAKGVSVRAHRFAYELAHGPIPEGMSVCHHCDTPRCCNPKHLFLGTDADNQRDSIAKGRNAPLPHPRGAKHPGAKLTESDVLELRAASQSGVGLTALARRFGVTKQAVWLIVQRRKWKHI